MIAYALVSLSDTDDRGGAQQQCMNGQGSAAPSSVGAQVLIRVLLKKLGLMEPRRGLWHREQEWGA